jgi:hypothetical protein
MKGNMETGSKYKVNCETSLTIVEDLGWDNVIVRFDSGYVTKTQRSSILKGTVKDKLFRSVCGAGYLGDGEYSRVDHKTAYQTWVDMLKRAYTEKKGRCNYFGVTVCEEWHNFQSFAKWCHSQDFFNIKDKYGKRYDLDKDILVKGSKTYSPETCCFVPSEINCLFIRNKRFRGKYPIGVTKIGKYFTARLSKGFGNRVSLGTFKTELEAFSAYKKAKELYLKELAEKYRNKVCYKTYLALINYEVDVDD